MRAQAAREFWIPSEKIEFAYLLAKKSWKGKTPERQSIRLRELAGSVGRSPKRNGLPATVFSGNSKKQAVRACLNESLATDVVGARKKFWKTGLDSPAAAIGRNSRLPIPRGWFGAKSGLPGILVAVMGPDGVGKSTVITGLIE